MSAVTSIGCMSFSDRIYIAPSGVQKERIDSSDLFVCDINGKDIEMPSSG